jgi:hypothetical protein
VNPRLPPRVPLSLTEPYPLSADLRFCVLPFVIWPGTSSVERTRLLELWANIILKVGWRAATALRVFPAKP